jgi:hypothetical protein
LHQASLVVHVNKILVRLTKFIDFVFVLSNRQRILALPFRFLPNDFIDPASGYRIEALKHGEKGFATKNHKQKGLSINVQLMAEPNL